MPFYRYSSLPKPSHFLVSFISYDRKISFAFTVQSEPLKICCQISYDKGFAWYVHWVCVKKTSIQNNCDQMGFPDAWSRRAKVNSVTPGRCGFNYKLVVFKLIPPPTQDTSSFPNEITLRRMPQNLTNVWSTLVQVMAWCLTAPSNYM